MNGFCIEHQRMIELFPSPHRAQTRCAAAATATGYVCCVFCIAGWQNSMDFYKLEDSDQLVHSQCVRCLHVVISLHVPCPSDSTAGSGVAECKSRVPAALWVPSTHNAASSSHGRTRVFKAFWQGCM